MYQQIDVDALEVFGTYQIKGSPERNLWMSVLERAILDFVGNSEKDVLAAEQWLFEDEGDEDEEKTGEFSFRWVCEQLDLDAKSISAIIRAMPKRGNRRVAPWYFCKDKAYLEAG